MTCQGDHMTALKPGSETVACNPPLNDIANFNIHSCEVTLRIFRRATKTRLKTFGAVCCRQLFRARPAMSLLTGTPLRLQPSSKMGESQQVARRFGSPIR